MSAAGPDAESGPDRQLALLREQVRRTPRPRRTAAGGDLAAELPVARVAVDVPLAHLDRPFDYAVPAGMAGSAVPGVRVRVRLAGALVDGFVLDRLATSEHAGTLTRLQRVVSAEPVLSAAVARTARAVADRYAGTLADVLRLAVPPRHARVEAEAPTPPPESGQVDGGGDEGAPVPDDGWAAYPGGAAFVAALAAGGAPRAAWAALPRTAADPFLAIATALAAAADSGRGGLAVLPDGRDVARLRAALAARAPGLPVAELTADLGPAERYRRWLAVRRGAVRTVVGTRAAVWAPVEPLGLVVCWDDGDDLHAEPRAPYPHVREVLLLRAHDAGAAVLLGGHLRTPEVQALVERRWLRPLEATRSDARRAAPRVRVAGDDAELARDPAARAARLPSLALRAARDALGAGPVLVQVAAAGYLPALACATCRAAARCPVCAGPLGTDRAGGGLRCGWCATPVGAFRCPRCGGGNVRSVRVGVRRTAEELGRAFPGAPVRTSGRDGVLDAVPGTAAVVVSTPGAEPAAETGYAAALLLDGDRQLARPTLRAAEEALRRWLAAAALVRPGGTVVLVADARSPAVQALVRWDPAGWAARELAERAAAALPPAVLLAELEGAPADLDDLLGVLEPPAAAEVLGPVPVPPTRTDGEDRRRALVRVPAGTAAARALPIALRAATGVRSAAKRGSHVRVRVDPVDLA